MKKDRSIKLIILVLIVSILVCFIYKFFSRDLVVVLKKNGYELVDKTLKGEESNYNVYKYKKGNIILYVFFFGNEKETRKIANEHIEQDKLLGLDIEVDSNNSYILWKVCEEEYCTYVIDCDEYYVTIDSNTLEMNSKIEKELGKLIGYKR